MDGAGEMRDLGAGDAAGAEGGGMEVDAAFLGQHPGGARAGKGDDAAAMGLVDHRGGIAHGGFEATGQRPFRAARGDHEPAIGLHPKRREVSGLDRAGRAGQVDPVGGFDRGGEVRSAPLAAQHHNDINVAHGQAHRRAAGGAMVPRRQHRRDGLVGFRHGHGHSPDR